MTASQHQNSRTIVTQEALLDPELGRLAVALHKAAFLRLWLIGHLLSKRRGGCGWILIDDLRSYLDDLPHYTITRRHFRRLLQRGENVFWRRTDDRLYLTGIARLAEDLMIDAGLQSRESLIQTNAPGDLKSVYVSLDGSHEELEAQIYRSWLAAKRSKTLSRDLLEDLWGRSANTLRTWESAHLSHDLTVIPSFALVSGPETPIYRGADYHPAMHSRVYQLPNTYAASARQHPRNGQRRKVQQAVTGPLEAVGADTRKLYFQSVSSLQSHVKRHAEHYLRFAFVARARGANYFKTSADIFLGL